MKHKTSFELLQEYAEDTDKILVFEDFQYPEPLFRKLYQKHKKAYLYEESNDAKLVFYSDPYESVGEHTAFCGAFITIDNVELTEQFSIRRKDILDKISFSKKDIGSAYFDSNFVLSQKEMLVPNFILKNERIGGLIKASLEIYDNLHFSINYPSVDFVPIFKGKAIIGIYHPQIWIIEYEILESLYAQINTLKMKIESAIASV